MRTYFLSFFALALLFWSCEDKAAQQMADLEKEVMVVHDEIMPNHMKLQNLQENLEEKLSSLNEAGAADSATVVQYHKAIGHLKDAVEGMDNWMHDWDMNYKEKGTEEALKYLNEQKNIIEKVKYHFQMSEEEANALLKGEKNGDK